MGEIEKYYEARKYLMFNEKKVWRHFGFFLVVIIFVEKS